MDTTARANEDPRLALVTDPGPAPAPILVVEPYAAGRRALRDSLEELGYQIVDVEDREQALRVSPSLSPALVISDFDPARAESIVLLDLLRARWPGVPAILLCANPQNVTEPPPGARLLAKPLAFEDLERAIASSIGVPARR